MGTIVADRGRVAVVGEPPYQVVFTPRLASLVLCCSPSAAAHAPGPSLPHMLQGLDAPSRASFEVAVQQDAQYVSLYHMLKEDFAGVANPETRAWPEPTKASILESLFVDYNRVTTLLCLLDGRRLVRDQRGVLSTFAEFQAMYGCNVIDYLRPAVSARITRLTRALAICETPFPTEYTLDLLTADHRPQLGLRVLAFDEQQIQRYLSANNLFWLNNPNAPKEKV